MMSSLGGRVVTTLSLIETFLKILAIIFGAAWAYYHYFRGRTYRPRLELSVKGSLFSHEGVDYTIATVKLHNVFPTCRSYSAAQVCVSQRAP